MIAPEYCPVCLNAMKLAVYGLPTKELAEDESVQLMGCQMWPGQPEWFCETCDTYS